MDFKLVYGLFSLVLFLGSISFVCTMVFDMKLISQLCCCTAIVIVCFICFVTGHIISNAQWKSLIAKNTYYYISYSGEKDKEVVTGNMIIERSKITSNESFSSILENIKQMNKLDKLPLIISISEFQNFNPKGE